MTTFGSQGKIVARADAAPAEEQLVPPVDYCAPDDDKDDPAPDVDAVLAEVAADNEPEVIVAPQDVPADLAVQDEPEDTGNAVALAVRFDVTTTGEEWKYDYLEFQGDKLGIRLPTRQALAAFSLASSKYVSMGVKNDLTGLFIARHLSPESYGRVFSRLMDPDDAEYDVDTVGELFNAIVTASIEADEQE
ncbi:hypothetical protein Nigel_22 [Mycobacterium phage Nigel]|uniref:Tail assembly chaperone n=2 Tax=Coopervirus TaxID=1982898 RepID=V5UNJ3_9CAUD|nr:tail assembly chaperone [Mycobacterium phage Nigel]YP_009004573.1 tail assembly chaperone [Mycobacterium phage JAMaL]ACF05025.1 hypothetical protein Nigel_22 [Mycobacterium phage Nigel]AHB79344.1 hypothetical protein JAMAL_24 [Mycobacterium phage JAMaL]